MPRRRNNSDAIQAEAQRVQMRALRAALSVGGPTFGRIIGMGSVVLNNRERGRSAWLREEIATAEARVREHLLAALAKLDALEF